MNPARQTEHTEKMYCCREPNTLHNHQQIPAEKTGQRGETTVLEIIAMIEKYIILSLKPIIYDSEKKKRISVAFKQAIAAKKILWSTS